jgi:ABC-type bacteriocin/lantibiotic exporter with double-glycine peptidase domain
LTIATSVLLILPNIFIGEIVDFLTHPGSSLTLVILCSAILFTTLVQNIIGQIKQFIIGKLVIRIISEIKIEIIEKILNLPVSFFKKTKRGDILQRAMDDPKQIQNYFSNVAPQFLQEIVSSALSIIVATLIYWPLILIGSLIYLIYFFPLIYFGRKQREITKEFLEVNSDLKNKFIEKLETIYLIKLFGVEKKEKKAISETNDKWAKLIQKRNVIDNLFRTMPRVLDALAPAIVFIIGGLQVFNDNLTIGQLVIITGLLPSINAPIRSFSSTFLGWKDISVPLQRVGEYLNLITEHSSETKIKFTEFRDSISFESVSFEVDDKYILRDISFTIQRGERIGIIGDSGSGKSTIFNLLSGLSTPTSGKILIDGVDLNLIDLTEYKSRLSVVTQNIFLFNESIRYNLDFISDYSEDELNYLISKLECGFIYNDLPKALDTLIGENGTILSGGQRQRITLLRALLCDFDILLLDEYTSALDYNIEKKITSFVNSNTNNTMIVIAHRLSTILEVDRILIINNGKIIEEGNPRDLLNQNSKFKELWESQNSEDGVA